MKLPNLPQTPTDRVKNNRLGNLCAVFSQLAGSVGTIVALAWFALSGLTLRAFEASLAQEEATLRDIAFIDVDRGWVVGDGGTVLKTEDGGANWRPLPSGTTYPLASIRMFNSQRGVAVGGGYQPHTQMGIGAVIWTDDGGQSWKPAETEALPPLRHLIVGLGGKCVAAGDWSPAHATSVFFSRNGGQSWEAVLAGVNTPIIGLAGTVDDFVLLGDTGEMTRVQTDKPAVRVGQRQTGRTAITANDRLIWVDQVDPTGHHSCLVSFDGGNNWETVAGGKTSASTVQTVLHSNQRWTLSAVSSTLLLCEGFAAGGSASKIADVPIRKIFRLDADRGWAVGDWGTIAVTRDGGKLWRTVRGGNRRPAVMAVAATADSLPWSLLAIESLQNQRRVAVVTAADDPLLATALGLIGPATAYVWKGDQPVDGESNRHAYPVRDRFGASASAILAETSPAVVVLDQNLSNAEKTAWTQAAVQAGAKRVFETGRNNGQILNNAAAMPNCGKLAGDVWNDAMMLLVPGTLAPETLRLGGRFDSINDQLSTDGLASFVGTDRRFVHSETPSSSRRHLQVLQARTGETAWIDSMLASNAPIDDLAKQFEANLPRWAPENQQRMVWRLIVASKAAGKAELHRAMLGQAARLWPNQPLGRLSRLFEQAIASSKEWESVSGLTLAVGGAGSGMIPIASAAADGDWRRDNVKWSPFQNSPFPSNGSGIVRAQAIDSSVANFDLPPDDSNLVRQVTAATTPPKQPESVADLAWSSHPLVRVIGRASEPPGMPIMSGTDQTAWSQQWRMLNRSEVGPKTIKANWGADRPYLDGKLDDSIWQSGQTFLLAGGGTAIVRIAYDAEFVYLAINGPRLQPPTTDQPARKQATKTTPTDSKPRMRDHELDGHDRYMIRLDVDGDLLTTYQLEFNSKPETRDSCDGFIHWQPTWFIAVEHDDETTIAEIAIKKSDLVGPLQTPGQHWNLSVVRPQPGKTVNRFELPNPQQWCRVVFD